MFNDLIKRKGKNWNGQAICSKCNLKWIIEFRNYFDKKDVLYYFKSKCDCGEPLILKYLNEGKNLSNNMKIFK